MMDLEHTILPENEESVSTSTGPRRRRHGTPQETSEGLHMADLLP